MRYGFDSRIPLMSGTRKIANSVDDYIALQREDVRRILTSIRNIILEIAPEAQELISYAIPAYKLHGKPLIYFAAFTNHVSLYPIPEGDAAFTKAIERYIKGKGTLQFPLTEPIPYDLMREIVRVRYKSFV